MEKRKNYKTLFAWVAVLLVLFSLVFTTGATASSTVFAESSGYTSVIEDLAKDENFSVGNYPAKANDYSLQVIQIAESTEKELLVYVYQPSAQAFGMLATTIRFSTSYEGGKWTDYPLTLLSSSGTLAKYRVEEFEVSEKSTRYYNITAIHREWNKVIDGGTITENHDSEIAVEVAQCWTVVSINDTVIYSMEYADVVEISTPFFGTVRYKDGQGWLHSYAVDAHFIAFSVTNWNIKSLLEADVSYYTATKKKGVWSSSQSKPEYHDSETVTYKEYGGTTGAHTFNSSKRTWDRIQTGADFARTCEPLDDSVRNEVKNYDWVLCYAETDYEDYTGGVFGWVNAIGSFLGANNTSSCTVVSGVTIMRLKFVTESDEVYNLGVVSNKGGTSGIKGDDSSGFWADFKDSVEGFFKGIWKKITNWFSSVSWWVWIIVAVVAIAIGLPLLCYFVPAVANVVIQVLKAIWKGLKWCITKLWWLICLPFRGIAALIRRRREKYDNKNNLEDHEDDKGKNKNAQKRRRNARERQKEVRAGSKMRSEIGGEKRAKKARSKASR